VPVASGLAFSPSCQIAVPARLGALWLLSEPMEQRCHAQPRSWRRPDRA